MDLHHTTTQPTISHLLPHSLWRDSKSWSSSAPCLAYYLTLVIQRNLLKRLKPGYCGGWEFCGTRIILCPLSIKNNTWRNFALPPNSCRGQLYDVSFREGFNFLLYASLYFANFLHWARISFTSKKTFLKMLFRCLRGKKKSMMKNNGRFFPSWLKNWNYAAFWHTSLPAQGNKNEALGM